MALENNLIKYYKPKYNRLLIRDDVGIAYIVLTGEEIPRFVAYRKNRRMNKELEGIEGKQVVKRFGPYASTCFRDILLAFVIDHFQIRTCKPIPQRVCLRYHLGKCGGICEHKISLEAYRESVDRAVAFLACRHAHVIDQMKQKMLKCAEDLEFETAHRIKGQIEALEKALERQIVERDVKHDQDVIYFGESHALIAHVTHGMMRNLVMFDLELDGDYDAACRDFLITYYQTTQVPQELIVNRICDPDRVTAALSSATGRSMQIKVPKGGAEYELLELCEQNYRYRTRESQ